ncbi:MAG: hypothetical protein LW825_05490 [Candidatus Jidaibacter sp.]|jgi:hypothetical protein|nr:hypothetical protein [Candidatus Jidaibacter sp.]
MIKNSVIAKECNDCGNPAILSYSSRLPRYQGAPRSDDGLNVFKLLLQILLLIAIPIITLANYYDDDCFKAMGGFKKTDLKNKRYQSFDKYGVKEACRNAYPSVNERLILSRTSADPVDVKYEVRRSYCTARNVFRDNSCSWGSGDSWGDHYSGTFLPSDVRRLGDKEGVITLQGPWSGSSGHRICLKKFYPNEVLPHGGKNRFKRNIVCGYVVYALVGSSCNSPLNSWSDAFIGCVEEPLRSPPPTYNPVITTEIAAYVDPDFEIENYISNYKSTFDQPVIKLLNGMSKNGELILRYKFPGDTSNIDQLLNKGSFPKDKNKLVYEARVDPNNPSQVCACESNSCDDKIYIGCVARPTPRQSNLKVVAEHVPHPAGGPAVTVNFAITNSQGEIIYYDKDNQRVVLRSDGSAFKADERGNVTNQQANGPLTYKKLPLSSPPIREYYLENSQGNAASALYKRDLISIYGVEFQAMIPRMQDDSTPTFITIDTPKITGESSGCYAYRIAEDQGNLDKPQFFLPAGERERSLCECRDSDRGKGVMGCYNKNPAPTCKGSGSTDHEEDALKVFCPGVLKEPSQVDKSDTICLENISGWNFTDYKFDKMCAKIPADCRPRPEARVSYGMSTWPQTEIQTATQGFCDTEAGLETTITHVFEPASLLPRSTICKVEDEACETKYADYVQQFATAVSTLNSLQNLAHTFNRNFNDDDINKVNKALGSFQKHHKLVKSPIYAPERSCKLDREHYWWHSLINYPCMMKNRCDAINKPSYINGFATWDEPRDLNADEQNKLGRQSLTEMAIPARGKCAPGYKESGGAPIRTCNIKFINKKLGGMSWSFVTNPCVPDEKAVKTTPAQPKKP